MKHLNNLKIAYLSLVCLFFSCDDFGDMNLNPNAPTELQVNSTLNNIVYKFVDQKMQNAFLYSNRLMQYHGQPDFNDIDRYQIEANAALWVTNYKLLGDLNDILKSPQINNATRAVAKLLKASIGAQLTDMYGYVPFFEAGDQENINPKYDSPEAIYTQPNGVLDLLTQAASTFAANTDQIPSDMLFNGDNTKWEKLANALLLRYCLRISEVHPPAKDKIRELVNGGQLLDKDENATLPYLTKPNNWFLSEVRDGNFKGYKLTSTLQDIFEKSQDTLRLNYFYIQIEDTVQKKLVYKGITPGSDDRKTNYSTMSDVMRAADELKMIYMTYFEQEFILAEAALKGIIGDAQTHYENAVKANFDYLGVEMPDDYLTDEKKAKWDEKLETLMTQKYLANRLNANEAWYDYRRTNLPTLDPAANNINENVIPVRFKYITEESFTNKANYDQAVQKMGGNTYNAKSWWDKK